MLDVSDKKEAEERLRASEERFRQFAENSADVFWILDAKTQQLEYVNPIYEKMFGQPRELVMRDRKRATRFGRARGSRRSRNWTAAGTCW